VRFAAPSAPPWAAARPAPSCPLWPGGRLALLALPGRQAQVAAEGGLEEALLGDGSLDVGQADFLKRLNANFGAIQEELRTLAAEQRELRRRLDACGCAAEGTRSSSAVEAGDGEEGVSPGAVAGPSLDSGGDWGPLVAVDVANTDWLKEVLFGGEPWVLHCVDGRASEPPEQQLPAIFQEAAVQLKSLASFGLLDCWQRTASGKTLAHRFDFPKPPVTFAVANGDPPALVDVQGMAKPWQLRRKLQGLVQASVARIGDPKSFKSFCTSRRACLVVGFKAARTLASAMRLLNPVLEHHRGVRAVAVDTSVWKVQLDKSLAATKPKRKGKQPKEQAEMLCISRQSGSSWQGAWLKAPADDAPPTEEALGSFLERCSKGSGMLAMTGPPSIAQRPPEQPPRPRAPPPSSTAPGPAAAGKGRGRAPTPSPRSVPGRGARARKDHVGSRRTLPEDEPLFSAVEEESNEGAGAEDAEGEAEEEDVEEVEL